MVDRQPTPAELREPAMRAYRTGEQLCDGGRSQEGIRSFAAAHALAWELDGESWPAWATALYDELASKPEPALLEGASAAFSGLHAPGVSSDAERWWLGSVANIACSLETHGFAVIDGFAGPTRASRLRECTLEAWRAGEFRPSRVTNAASPALRSRSDHICFDPPGMDALSGELDALVRMLREATPELSAVSCRQRPMVSRFGFGDTFVRHVDNHCLEGKGAHCNGRLLTTVYYMQPSAWDAAADGGCLRIFGSQQPPAGSAEPLGETEPLFDVAPRADRLVLFFSDFRVPHEVLPVRRAGAERFAATVWYKSSEAVPAWWEEGVHDRSLVALPRAVPA